MSYRSSNSHSIERVLFICKLFGDSMTESQAESLMDWIRDNVSISDRQILLNHDDVIMSSLYPLLSENNGETGGYSRY